MGRAQVAPSPQFPPTCVCLCTCVCGMLNSSYFTCSHHFKSTVTHSCHCNHRPVSKSNVSHNLHYIVRDIWGYKLFCTLFCRFTSTACYFVSQKVFVAINFVSILKLILAYIWTYTNDRVGTRSV